MHDLGAAPVFDERAALRAPFAHLPAIEMAKNHRIRTFAPRIGQGWILPAGRGTVVIRHYGGTEHTCASLVRPETSESGENLPSEPPSEARVGRWGQALLVGRLSKGVLARPAPVSRPEPSDVTALLKTLRENEAGQTQSFFEKR